MQRIPCVIVRRVDFAEQIVISVLVPVVRPSSGSRRLRTVLLAVFTFAVSSAMVVLIGGNFVDANGASTTIMDRVQGPYQVVVGIIPARPVVPQTHLAIQVFDSSEERLLRDTEVDLQVTAHGLPARRCSDPNGFSMRRPCATSSWMCRSRPSDCGMCPCTFFITRIRRVRNTSAGGRAASPNPVDLDRRPVGGHRGRGSLDVADSATPA